MDLEVLTLAADMLKARRFQFAQWRENHADEVALGLRPSHCVHGRNMWLDAECGACDAGLGEWDGFYLAHLADIKEWATAVIAMVNARRDTVMNLMQAGAPVSGDLIMWASAPLTDWK